MDVSKLDLNLIKVLLVLLQEKNTHKAAERLDTSQPAVSRSLAKLRIAMGDPLFVRHNRGLKLTPRAEELAVSLPLAYAQLQSSLEGHSFHPSDISGKFRVALNGFLIESHGCAIYHFFMSQCPSIELEIVSFSSSTIKELINGECDIAFTYQPLTSPKELYQKNIGFSRFGFICRQGLVELDKVIKIDELEKYRWAGLIVPEFNAQIVFVQRYSNFSGKPVFRSQHVNPILGAILDEDMLFIAPENFFRIVDQCKYQFVDMDEPGSLAKRVELDIVMVYNSRFWSTSKYKWLESQFTKVIQQ